METPSLCGEPGEFVVGRCFVGGVDTTFDARDAQSACERRTVVRFGRSLLELDWWHVADRSEEATVVPPVDPPEGGELDVFDGAPRSLGLVVDELGLVEPVDRLGQ